MTVIKLRGSWTKDELPNIGISTELADYMAANRLTRLPVNAILECDEVRDPTHNPRAVIFRVVALEAAMAGDGTDPGGRGAQTLDLIDTGRKLRNLAAVEETLFDHYPGDRDDEPDDDEVPPPSGEELLAEHRERRRS